MATSQGVSRPSQDAPSVSSVSVEEIHRPDLEEQLQAQNQNNRGGALAEDSDIEEIPRPDLQPQQHVWQVPPVLINTTPWRRYVAFIILSCFDIAMNAAAGSAAATVGAKMNHKPLTGQVVRLGALAGVTKAGITSFNQLILMSPINLVFRVVLLLIFSSFGICLVLTAEICNIVLGETPKELLIAAVVAAIPLVFESVRELEPKPDEEGNTDYLSRPILSIFLLGSNALGGYVFARMASNQGMPISNYSAACSAGAIYGFLTFLSRTMTACVTCVQVTRHGVTQNVFGRYEWHQPEPIVITEEEYRRMNQMAGRAVERLFHRMSRLVNASETLRSLVLRAGAKLTYCFCCMAREDRHEIRDGLREKANRQKEATENMQGWVTEMQDSFPGKARGALAD